MQTSKQTARQKIRNASGQYGFVNPCYGCQKSAGLDYLSHPLSDCDGEDGKDWGDAALCLCVKCHCATANMKNVSEFESYAASKQNR